MYSYEIIGVSLIIVSESTSWCKIEENLAPRVLVLWIPRASNRVQVVQHGAMEERALLLHLVEHLHAERQSHELHSDRAEATGVQHVEDHVLRAYQSANTK